MIAVNVRFHKLNTLLVKHFMSSRRGMIACSLPSLPNKPATVWNLTLVITFTNWLETTAQAWVWQIQMRIPLLPIMIITESLFKRSTVMKELMSRLKLWMAARLHHHLKRDSMIFKNDYWNCNKCSRLALRSSSMKDKIKLKSHSTSKSKSFKDNYKKTSEITKSFRLNLTKSLPKKAKWIQLETLLKQNS